MAWISGSFTEQGNGFSQIFSLVSTPAKLYELLHQVTIATPAITNLTCLTHTPEIGGWGVDRLTNYTAIYTHSGKLTQSKIHRDKQCLLAVSLDLDPAVQSSLDVDPALV